MSILTDIVHRASLHSGSTPAAGQHESPAPRPATDGAATQAGVNPEVLARQASSNASPSGQNVQEMHDRSGGSATRPRASVDAAFNELARRKSASLNWQGSIVDLLELLDLDSGPETRRKLADELDYAGDRNDMEAMDAWLHGEVMRTLNARMG
jgi:hypothetical protein